MQTTVTEHYSFMQTKLNLMKLKHFMPSSQDLALMAHTGLQHTLFHIIAYNCLCMSMYKKLIGDERPECDIGRRYSLRQVHHRPIFPPLLCLMSRIEGFSWDNLRKILHVSQRMVKVQNGKEILLKV